MENLDMSQEQIHHLLQAHALIWRQTFSFVNSIALKFAIQLGIPDAVHEHGKPIALDELAKKLDIRPNKLNSFHRVMRCLCFSGFVKKVQSHHGAQSHVINENENENEGYYLLTDASQLLLTDHPFSQVPFVLGHMNPAMLAPAECIAPWFRNEDQTPFHTAFGESVWEYAGHEDEFNESFNKAMATDSKLIGNLLRKDGYGREIFDGLTSLVDVCGGTGTVAKAIASAYPKIKCMVLDLPHVVADMKGTENLAYIEGDMFKEIPPADAVLLKWALHDWNDEECVKIMKNCKKAIQRNGHDGVKSGKVIIIDMVVEPEDGGDKERLGPQLAYDLLMLVFTSGKERNEKEWKKLFMDAGFSGYKIFPMLGLRSIIEVYP